MTTAFWPTLDHWSVAIPRDTDHLRLAALEPTGFVALRDAAFAVPEREYLDLEYMDWKSGGDTNFAPIATMDGELDCRGFWSAEQEHADKDAVFTSNADLCPTIRDYVRGVGANFGRVRIIKLEPQDHATALRSFHRDDNNRFNPEGTGWVVRTWVELTDSPDSYMLLMDLDEDNLDVDDDDDGNTAIASKPLGASVTASSPNQGNHTQEPTGGPQTALEGLVGVSPGGSSLEIHFGKNKGTPLAHLTRRSLEWYRSDWEPSPNPRTGEMNPADVRLKAAVIEECARRDA